MSKLDSLDGKYDPIYWVLLMLRGGLRSGKNVLMLKLVELSNVTLINFRKLLYGIDEVVK